MPVLILAGLAVLISEGWPVFYASRRRHHRQDSLKIYKFRTLKKRADQVFNRDTVPVSSQRFLNISIDSPLYTPVGRWLERLCITELPQVFHVLAGTMTLVGNRPLPENVISSLREVYPTAEERFDTPAGLTGPVQLIGRDVLSDEERLRLEIRYCQLCNHHYTPVMDFMLLLYTVLICIHIKPKMNAVQVEDKLERWCGITSSPLVPEMVPLLTTDHTPHKFSLPRPNPAEDRSEDRLDGSRHAMQTSARHGVNS